MAYELTPPSGGAQAVLVGVAALVAALALGLAWVAWSASRATVAVQDGALTLRAPLYGRSVPLDRLDLDAAEIVPLGATPALQPRLRTNGVGLPGYALGWFRMADGSKALLAVAGGGDVLRVPTRDGWALVLGVREPERLLDALRAAR